MKAIFQIMLGMTLTVWRFAQPRHGFWQQQIRYHDYSPNATTLLNAETIVIYLACSLLIGSGLYRMLSAKTIRQLRKLKTVEIEPGATNRAAVSSN